MPLVARRLIQFAPLTAPQKDLIVLVVEKAVRLTVRQTFLLVILGPRLMRQAVRHLVRLVRPAKRPIDPFEPQTLEPDRLAVPLVEQIDLPQVVADHFVKCLAVPSAPQTCPSVRPARHLRPLADLQIDPFVRRQEHLVVASLETAYQL